MRITLTTGCTAYGMSVDGQPYEDLSPIEEKSIHKKVLKALKERLENGEISLWQIVEAFPVVDTNHSEHSCEICGDSISRYIYEI